MSDRIAVKIDGVSKSFRLPHEKNNSIKGAVINLRKNKKSYETQQVLKNISFEIKKGEFFGVVGRNGSGKSTLLKLLSGIYSPDSGTIQINGKLIPFIELGVGFNPELTGRENVFLNGALLGFSRKEMSAMYDGIVEFAELERFMDQRLKNYSSGMQVRLAFSIAIRANTDILVLDEVLAVGDESFQRKCFEYFGELKRKNKTVILVTHDMAAVERFCTSAMLLENGQVKVVGLSSEIAHKYKELFTENINQSINKESEKNNPNDGILDGIMNSFRINTYQNNKTTSIIESHTPFSVKAELNLKDTISKAAMGVNIINSQGQIVIAMGFGGQGEEEHGLLKGLNKIKFTIDPNILTDDTYFLNAAVAKKDGYTKDLIYQNTEMGKFIVRGIKTRSFALAHTKIAIDIQHTKK